MNLGERGEFGLIGMLAQRFPPNDRTLVGIGDDAAVLAAPDGRVVATTDFVLEGRHFTRDWAKPADIGHKAAARSLSDLAAMGAVPSALLVALAAPADLPVSWLDELAEGLAGEAARAGAAVIGGDTARAGQIVLAVTGLGDLEGRQPVLRSGARPGDIVAVAGLLGHAAAGLCLLSAPPLPSAPTSSLRSVGASAAAGTAAPPGQQPPWPALADAELAPLLAAQLRPSPRYQAGPEAAVHGATAMIDISDGLLADLAHVAVASDVLIDVDSAGLADPLLERAWSLTTDASRPAPPATWLHWALTGGEDHVLVASFPPGVPLPAGWRQIARVLPPDPALPTRVVVDGRPWPHAPGWDHFR